MRQVREVFFPFDCKPFQGSGQRQLPYTVQFMTQNVSQAWKLSWIWFACGYDFHFQFFFGFGFGFRSGRARCYD